MIITKNGAKNISIGNEASFNIVTASCDTVAEAQQIVANNPNISCPIFILGKEFRYDSTSTTTLHGEYVINIPAGGRVERVFSADETISIDSIADMVALPESARVCNVIVTDTQGDNRVFKFILGSADDGVTSFGGWQSKTDYLKVSWSGAVSNGTDQTVKVQKVLDLGGEIRVNEIYTARELVIDKSTSLYGYGGGFIATTTANTGRTPILTIDAGHTEKIEINFVHFEGSNVLPFPLNNANYKFVDYGVFVLGSSNVTVRQCYFTNLHIASSTAQVNSFPTPLGTAPMENIKYIDNTFYNNMAGIFLGFSSLMNSTVKGNMFDKFCIAGIKIDGQFLPSDTVPVDPDWDDTFDTWTENIQVFNNTFKDQYIQTDVFGVGSTPDGAVFDGAVSIQEHCRDIQVMHNTFLKIQADRGLASAITLTNGQTSQIVQDIQIAHNTASVQSSFLTLSYTADRDIILMKNITTIDNNIKVEQDVSRDVSTNRATIMIVNYNTSSIEVADDILFSRNDIVSDGFRLVDFSSNGSNTKEIKFNNNSLENGLLNLAFVDELNLDNNDFKEATIVFRETVANLDFIKNTIKGNGEAFGGSALIKLKPNERTILSKNIIHSTKGYAVLSDGNATDKTLKIIDNTIIRDDSFGASASENLMRFANGGVADKFSLLKNTLYNTWNPNAISIRIPTGTANDAKIKIHTNVFDESTRAQPVWDMGGTVHTMDSSNIVVA